MLILSVEKHDSCTNYWCVETCLLQIQPLANMAQFSRTVTISFCLNTVKLCSGGKFWHCRKWTASHAIQLSNLGGFSWKTYPFSRTIKSVLVYQSTNHRRFCWDSTYAAHHFHNEALFITSNHIRIIPAVFLLSHSLEISGFKEHIVP